MVEVFPNGTYQLANLDGTLHGSRVNGLRIKQYHARLMVVLSDELHDSEEVADVVLMTEDALDNTALFSAD